LHLPKPKARRDINQFWFSRFHLRDLLCFDSAAVAGRNE
jgi:hypothetical protein